MYLFSFHCELICSITNLTHGEQGLPNIFLYVVVYKYSDGSITSSSNYGSTYNARSWGTFRQFI